MYAHDWRKFIEQGMGREIAVATLSQSIADHLSAPSRQVFYHHAYVVKAVQQHGLDLDAFEHLFDTIEFGHALDDKPRHVTFLYEAGLGWLHATIKLAETSRRLYVCTFYRTRLKEVERKLRRYPEIR